MFAIFASLVTDVINKAKVEGKYGEGANEIGGSVCIHSERVIELAPYVPPPPPPPPAMPPPAMPVVAGMAGVAVMADTAGIGYTGQSAFDTAASLSVVPTAGPSTEPNAGASAWPSTGPSAGPSAGPSVVTTTPAKGKMKGKGKAKGESKPPETDKVKFKKFNTKIIIIVEIVACENCSLESCDRHDVP